MQKSTMFFGIAALTAAAAIALAGCPTDGGGDNNGGGNGTALSGTVTITGTAKYGETLTADTAALGGTGAISYQWKRDGADITGATAATYTLIYADVGKTIKVETSRAGVAGTVTSAATAAIAGYALGDTGPGGGKIFHVSAAGFTLYQSATDTTGVTALYLEAAPADISVNKAWASTGFADSNIPEVNDSPAANTAIGRGKKNTALILVTDADAPAAKACKEYANGGRSDWFLPSLDELLELYANRTVAGDNLAASNYLASNNQNTNGKSVLFSTGAIGNSTKSYPFSVRPVRAF